MNARDRRGIVGAVVIIIHYGRWGVGGVTMRRAGSPWRVRDRASGDVVGAYVIARLRRVGGRENRPGSRQRCEKHRRPGTHAAKLSYHPLRPPPLH